MRTNKAYLFYVGLILGAIIFVLTSDIFKGDSLTGHVNSRNAQIEQYMAELKGNN